MKKRWLTITLAAVMAGLLAACGGTKEPEAKTVDLTQLYSEIEEACAWDEGYMVDIEGEMLDAYYPGLSEIATKQLVAKMPMMSAVVNEMVFAECETEEDAAAVAAVLQSRIDYQVGDENNPGGAWYPESIAAWEKGEVIQQGTYVALVASASYQEDIVNRFNAALA